MLTNNILGTSIGFGTTTLGLCDVVYSVGNASFSTPFMKLGKNEKKKIVCKFHYIPY